MRSALRHDPQMQQAMVALTGRERVGRLAAGLEAERAASADPHVRAERFVADWRELKSAYERVPTWPKFDGERGVIAEKMRAMGQSLARDPQMASLLDGRRRDLGVAERVQETEDLARDLDRSVTEKQRSQDIGLGLER